METKQTLENLNEITVFGLKGILKIIGFKKDILKNIFFKISIIIMFIILIISVSFSIGLLELILEFKDIMLNFLPSILGFTLAGYTLVVGFVQNTMLNHMTEPNKVSKFGLYLRMSANFALNIIFQAIALIVAYCVHLINYFNEQSKFYLKLDDSVIYIINLLGLLVISFWFTISLLLIIQITINIFNFSQLHQYFINKNKLDKKDKTQENI